MNFLKYTKLYFILSGILVLTSLISLILFGLRPAIDFTGGSLIEYQFPNTPDIAQIRDIINQQSNINLAGLQTASSNQIIIKTTTITPQQASKLKQNLEATLNTKLTQLRFETIGPTLGRELLTKTITAVIITAIFILWYVAWTFKNFQFGATAILAMFHDTLILLGAFSLLGHFLQVEVDILFVTAVLTTLSFSVHDTIVVFDRIRESRKQFPHVPITRLANKALTETMSRSLNNSLTIIFMLSALMLLGGASLRWFVTALLIGTIAGTYSSPFVAVPLLVTWHKLTQK